MNNIDRKTLNILFVVATLVSAVSIATVCDRAYLAVIFPLWVVSGYFKGYWDSVARNWDETKKLLDGQMEYVKVLEKELVEKMEDVKALEKELFEKTREIENSKKNGR